MTDEHDVLYDPSSDILTVVPPNTEGGAVASEVKISERVVAGIGPAGVITRLRYLSASTWFPKSTLANFCKKKE